MSELPASEAVFKRQVRIQCQPDKDCKLLGIATAILDAETGDVITNVAKVVITLDPGDVNKAEITYYETDADGKLLMKDGDVVASTAESIDPEVDITAFEVKHES